MRLTHLRGRFGRRRSWRRRIAGSLLLLILVLVSAYLYLANPQRLSAFASRLLEDMTGAEVAIDEASFAIDGTIRLRGLRLRVPGVSGEAGRLFEAEQVTIGHRLTSLLRGRFDATSLVVFSPTLVLTQDVATEAYNYQLLRERRRSSPGQVPERLPEVFVRQGMIEFAELDNGRMLPLGVVKIDGKLTQIDEQPGAYFFSLRQMAGERAEAQLTGRFNLRDLSVSAELDRFTFNNPYGSILPRRLRAWWQRLNPAGSLPTFRIAYDPDPAVGLYAVIEVRDVELSLPYADASEEPGQPQYPRMSDVSGTFAVIRDTVRIDALRGKIAGIDYQIDGRIEGLDEAAPFRFKVLTDEFEIPDDPGLYSMPRVVEKELRRFAPAGKFIAHATIQRRKRGASIDYEGALHLRGVNARYERFAFPLRDVHGIIKFNDKLIDVDHLNAKGPNGGTLRITGAIAPPGDGAAVELRISCRDLPVDEHVLDHIEPKYLSIIEMLADRDEHARMASLGHIRRAIAEPAANASDTAAFELGGNIDIDIHVTRNFGPVEPYIMNAVLDMAGINIMFRYWPYPLQLTGGTVRVGPDAVVVENVTAVGSRGGGGTMNGVVARVPGASPERWDPDLNVTDASIPLDDMLLATIPPPHDHWLREFRLQGWLDAAGRIYARPDGEIDFAIDARLRDARAEPFTSGFAVTDLTGLARIERGRVAVSDMTGRRGDSDLTMKGRADWSVEPNTLTLEVGGRNLVFEPSLVGLVPSEFTGRERVRTLFDHYKPAGQFDATFAYDTGGGTGPRFRLMMQPQTLSFDLRGVRAGFQDVSGRVVVTADTVELDNLAASFAHGRVSGSGLVNTGDQPAAAITFSVEASKIDDVARAVLPPAVVRTIDGLELNGAYTIPRARYLHRTPHQGIGGDTTMEFEGLVQLTDAVASVGVPITAMDGELYVMATQTGDVAWPRLDVRLDAKSLKAAGRTVEPLQLHLITSDQRPDLLQIEQLRGVTYGGLLIGEGWVDLARQGMYRLAITLSEVALQPLLYPDGIKIPTTDPAVTQDAEDAEAAAAPVLEAAEPVRIEPDQVTPDPVGDRSGGVLTASLSIEGVPGDVASRRGRGAVDIRNASLYELPLALAALQIANLTIPRSNAFDRASARFIIDGDRMKFDAIRFEAPTVEMSGDGEMHLPTQRLKIRLVSRNPAAPQLGAVSELFNVIKDELITILVTGTLDDPKASVRSLRGVKSSVDRVIGDPSATPPPKPPTDPQPEPAPTTSGQ